MAGPVLAARGVSKSFGAIRALSSVDFEVRAGEVHVIAGENGAGKSTLIRILSGACAPDAGELEVSGRKVRFASPEGARAAGIATIHQELSLVGSMSVADNLDLVRRGRALSFVRRGAARTAAKSALEAMDLDVSPDALVESLPLATRQLVEIARALAQEARVIVMDEPTSALGEPDAERLFSRVLALREAGKAIVFISHRTGEIYRVADRITVLRDGRSVVSRAASELGPDALVHAMVGRSVGDSRREPRPARPSELGLSVDSLVLRASDGADRHVLDRVSLAVPRGDIVGIAGLRGSGASEILHALFGSFGPVARATVRIDGAPFEPRSPGRSLASGVVLCTSDRAASVLPDMSVLHNATLSSLARVSRGPWVDAARETARAAPVAKELGIVAPSFSFPAGALSGGNQQKVALARCLLAEPRVLLLDDPTRGIDVAAKADLRQLVRDLAARGVAVLVVSSDARELVALADRVVVLVRGRVAAELAGTDLSHDRVLAAAMGPTDEAA